MNSAGEKNKKNKSKKAREEKEMTDQVFAPENSQKRLPYLLSI